MTVPAHNVLGLATVSVLVGLLGWYLHRRTLTPLASGFLVAVASAGLLLMGLVSAFFYRGSSFGSIQLVTWSVFLHLPLLLVGTAVLLKSRLPTIAVGALGTAAILGIVALDAFLIEPYWLEISQLTLQSEKLSEPIRVVVLADIQTDRPGRYEARVFEKAMAQKPDLILFAGDYIQLGRRSRSYETEVAALRELIAGSGLSAPLGIYAVAGNVDRPGVWTRVFDGLPVETIEETERHDLGPVVLTGLGMADAFATHRAVPREEAFHIVMGHSPNFSLGPVEGDLLIAGHTHGGQVQLPFVGPVFSLSMVPRAWASGVTEIAPGQMLVVSRGIGLERSDAPRMRFMCRPELVVIDLAPS
ncbi:MAG: metallophosphoesterase [Anaerolineae bacterium]